MTVAGGGRAFVILRDGNSRVDRYPLQADGTYGKVEYFRSGKVAGNGVFTLTFADGGRWTFRQRRAPLPGRCPFSTRLEDGPKDIVLSGGRGVPMQTRLVIVVLVVCAIALVGTSGALISSTMHERAVEREIAERDNVSALVGQLDLHQPRVEAPAAGREPSIQGVFADTSDRPGAIADMSARLDRIEARLDELLASPWGAVPHGLELPGGVFIGMVLGEVVTSLGEAQCSVLRDQNGNTFVNYDRGNTRYWFSPTTLQLVHAERMVD